MGDPNSTPKEPSKRNDTGDLITNQKPFDWDTARWWDNTYIFKIEQIKDGDTFFKPYFDIHRHIESSHEDAKNNSEYIEIKLFDIPKDLKERDECIVKNNKQLNLFVTYFKEVFNDNPYKEGHAPQFKFLRVILPKVIYNKIEKIINDNGLRIIHDLIYEIIAVAQHQYTKHVHYVENQNYENLIKNIDDELDILGEVLGRLDDEEWNDDHLFYTSKLDYINFVYQDGAKRIKDPMLMSYILRLFKTHLNQGLHKDWRKELKSFQRFYDDIKKQLQFRFDLANSLYNLFTKENFIELTKETRYPVSVIRPITQIMELCLIPISKPDSLTKAKENNVTNWIIRKQIDQEITHLTVEPNVTRIAKYFENDFINITDSVKTADVVYIADYLKYRFDIPEDLFPDLAHITQCLKTTRLLLGNQLSIKGKKKPNRTIDYTSLQCLVQSLMENKKIISLNFKIEGDENEYKFSERLPNYLIEQALVNHIKSHEEDFQVDIFKGRVRQSAKNQGAYHLEQEKIFHLPSERFQVRFVKSFYNYLKNEFPPSKEERYPSRKYFTIIAAMMQQTWFFLQIQDPESFIIEKVEHWHSLSLEK